MWSCTVSTTHHEQLKENTVTLSLDVLAGLAGEVIAGYIESNIIER